MTDFDAIVVGSGLSGGWVAKELCERGLKVCVVERGRDIAPTEDYTDFQDPWEQEHLGLLSDETKRDYPIQHTLYTFKNNTKQFWVKDNDHPYIVPEGQKYSWMRGYHTGGRSITWGRQSYRMSEVDFAANAKDGHGVDWPIRYADIEPWYAHVERFAGISGSSEGLEILPDSVFQPPFELTCAEQEFKRRVEGAFPGRKVIPSRVAHLTRPTEEQLALGRGKCQVRNVCHRGCLFGAYFSSNSATLPAARNTGNLTLLNNTAVHGLDYDAKTRRVTGVRTMNVETREARTLTARVVFLNAGTIPTSLILLNSKSRGFESGIANSSGQVGRNLIGHAMGATTTASVPGFLDKNVKGRRPGGFYIPRFRNHTEEGEGFLRGFGYQGLLERADWGAQSSGKGIGVELKKRTQTPGPWRMWMMAFSEILPSTKNHVRLHESKTDKWGFPVPVLDARVGSNEIASLRQASRDARKMLQEAGYLDIAGDDPATLMPSTPGESIHEMGTARMGKDPRTSVLNKWNQTHDVENLFVTDGSLMASGGCQNPSLTFMAFSARAANYAADRMQEGTL